MWRPCYTLYPRACRACRVKRKALGVSSQELTFLDVLSDDPATYTNIGVGKMDIERF